MLQGRVALIQRGVCTFESKVKLAQNAGAIGAVIYNNMLDDLHTAPFTMADDGAVAGVTIPAVMVGSFAGLELTALVRAALLSPPDVRVTVPVVGGGSAGIADFSSRGPMEDKRIKPDVMAPGAGITSAASDGSLSSTHQCSSTDVVEMSGTSMATPIVAGQHTSAYGSIRQHTSAYVCIRQHTSAYVSIRQHTHDLYGDPCCRRRRRQCACRHRRHTYADVC